MALGNMGMYLHVPTVVDNPDNGKKKPGIAQTYRKMV